jgi:hypothetical protein
MPYDIDWENACNDFHPDFALVRGEGGQPHASPVPPARLRHATPRRRKPVMQTPCPRDFHSGVHSMSDFSSLAQNWGAHGIALFNSAIFLDSLRYKFTDHPKTQEIFGRLDAWAGSIGAPGLFGHTGIFSQYTIGAAELAASACLIVGLLAPGCRFLQPVGALLGLAIMSGAISFHLFTPLGVDPNNDGGGLFRAACLVWLGCLALVVIRWRELGVLTDRIGQMLAPAI